MIAYLYIGLLEDHGAEFGVFLEIHALDVAVAVGTLVGAGAADDDVRLEQLVAELDVAEEALGEGVLLLDVLGKLGFVDDFGALRAFGHVSDAEGLVDDEAGGGDGFRAVHAGRRVLHYCLRVALGLA